MDACEKKKCASSGPHRHRCDSVVRSLWVHCTGAFVIVTPEEWSSVSVSSRNTMPGHLHCYRLHTATCKPSRRRDKKARCEHCTVRDMTNGHIVSLSLSFGMFMVRGASSKAQASSCTALVKLFLWRTYFAKLNFIRTNFCQGHKTKSFQWEAWLGPVSLHIQNTTQVMNKGLKCISSTEMGNDPECLSSYTVYRFAFSQIWKMRQKKQYTSHLKTNTNIINLPMQNEVLQALRHWSQKQHYVIIVNQTCLTANKVSRNYGKKCDDRSSQLSIYLDRMCAFQ